MTRTTSTGTTVTLHEGGPDRIVRCDHPDAPPELRNHEVGRAIEGGFQPAPFMAVSLSPGVLRAIADLIEETR